MLIIIRLSSTPLRSSSSSPATDGLLNNKDSSLEPMVSSFVAAAENEAPPIFSPIVNKELLKTAGSPQQQLTLSPISEQENIESKNNTESHLIKPS